MLLLDADLLRTRFSRGELTALAGENMPEVRLFDAGVPAFGVGLNPAIRREAERGEPPYCAESERVVPSVSPVPLRAGDGLDRRYRGGVIYPPAGPAVDPPPASAPVADREDREESGRPRSFRCEGVKGISSRLSSDARGVSGRSDRRILTTNSKRTASTRADDDSCTGIDLDLT